MSEITERLKVAIAARYLIERELGQGGMATVYLAHDVKHDRKVALKVLRPELAAVIGAERFLQEIKVTANLQHSHILPLYDSGAAEGFLFYVMPYVEGETLRTRIDREKQLGVDVAVALTRAIAGALEHAHRQGVVHRDIKPENILLRDGDPLIADFGIALAVSHAGGHRLTETGLSIGTPHYMSPEQAMGDRELDARSDVYSLGAVLYEMLTGDPPYQGSTAQAIVARVITEEPRSITLQRRTVPPHVADAVHKALNKLPADRFSSAASFGEALVTPGYVTPTQTRAGSAAVRPRGDRRLVVATGLLTVMTGLAGWGLLRRTPEPPSHRMRVAFMSGPVPFGHVGRQLALSPDGQTMVFRDTVGGTPQLWSKTPERADPEPLSGTAGAMAPVFSPDGRWIAFLAEGRVRKVPRAGGAAVTIGDSAGTEFVASVAWLESGQIAYVDPAFGVRLVPEDGGPSRRFDLVAELGMGVVSVAAVPGGHHVLVGLCTFGCPTSRLALLDLATGEVDSVADLGYRGWFLEDGLLVFIRPDGGVFAGEYDIGARRFRSAPIPVLEGVRTQGADPDLAIAANGTLLYVPGAASGGTQTTEVVWVTRDGRVSPVDSGWSYTPAGNGGLRLSPDDRRLAVSIAQAGGEDIWIKELDRGPLTRLTFGGLNTRPEWSPDGRHVMFFTGGVNDGNVYRRRADGTGGIDTVIDIERAVWEVAAPRDTSLLILRLGVPPTRDIYLLRRGAGDSVLEPLIASDAHEEVAIGLSPDGRWLAYASNESGRYEVYVSAFPDPNAGRWQVSRDGGNEPRWSHSGRELFYRNGAGDLVAATVQAEPGFVVGEQRRLLPASGYHSNSAYPEYDVSRDDQRFLFKRFIGADEPAVASTAILVLNWGTELRARLAGR